MSINLKQWKALKNCKCPPARELLPNIKFGAKILRSDRKVRIFSRPLGGNCMKVNNLTILKSHAYILFPTIILAKPILK